MQSLRQARAIYNTLSQTKKKKKQQSKLLKAWQEYVLNCVPIFEYIVHIFSSPLAQLPAAAT